MNLFEYDKSSKKSILKYAKQLKGKSISDVYNIEEEVKNKIKTVCKLSGNKGVVGNFTEEFFFGIKNNNEKKPDFEDANLELKTTGLVKRKKGLSVKERLVLSKINYNEIIAESWDENSLIPKIKYMLLMFYMYKKGIKLENCKDVVFDKIGLFELPKEDLKVIKKDWEVIVSKVRNGKAHELSEGDTNYLGACTKGATSADRTTQPNSDKKAKPRAFSLKRSYMQVIYDKYILNKKGFSLDNKSGLSFDDIVLDIFNGYEGKSIQEIVNLIGYDKDRIAKNYLSNVMKALSKHHFSKDLKKSDEFLKAGISEFKTILLNKDDKCQESMSFPYIKYDEIILETWKSSKVRDMIHNKRHLWIVLKTKTPYEKQSDIPLDEIYFEKAIFWNMPYNDLEKHYKKLWNLTVSTIKNRNIENIATYSSDNEVGHIRPKNAKGAKVEYLPLIKNSETFKEALSIMPKYGKFSFWFNADYVAEQIKKAK